MRVHLISFAFLVIASPIYGQDLTFKVGGVEVTATPVEGLVSITGFQGKEATPASAAAAVAEMTNKLDSSGSAVAQIASPGRLEIVLNLNDDTRSMADLEVYNSVRAVAMAAESVEKQSIKENLSTRQFYRIGDSNPFRFQGSYSVMLTEAVANSEDMQNKLFQKLNADLDLVNKFVFGKLAIFNIPSEKLANRTDSYCEQVRHQLANDYQGEIASADHNFAALVPQEDASPANPADSSPPVLVDPSWYRGEFGMCLDEAQQLAKGVTEPHKEVRVAIIDSGLNLEADLLKTASDSGQIVAGFDAFGFAGSDKTWANKTDFESSKLSLSREELEVDESKNLLNVAMHGSKVFAVIESIAPGTKVLNVKVFAGQKGAAASNSNLSVVYEDSVLIGFAWCLALQPTQRPHVINASLGYEVALDFDSRTQWNHLLSESARAGILVVVAAGNYGNTAGGRFLNLPAGHKDVLTVGAAGPRHDVMTTGQGLTAKVYGNSKIEIRDYTSGIDPARGAVAIVAFSSPNEAAKGVFPYFDTYRLHTTGVSPLGFGKTSGATAVVAGVACLAKSVDLQNNLASPDKLICLLQATADKPFPKDDWNVDDNGRLARPKSGRRDARFGFGVVNAARAIKEVLKLNSSGSVASLGCEQLPIATASNTETKTVSLSQESVAQSTTPPSPKSTPVSEVPTVPKTADSPAAADVDEPPAQLPIKIDGVRYNLPASKDHEFWITVPAEESTKQSVASIKSFANGSEILVRERTDKGLFLHTRVTGDKVNLCADIPHAILRPVRDSLVFSDNVEPLLFFGKITVRFSSTKIDKDQFTAKANKHQFRVRWSDDVEQPGAEAILETQGDHYPTDAEYAQLFKDLDSPDVLTFHPRFQQRNALRAD